jgi:L-serine dehydratase
MFVSTFDIFKVGIGPSSSHTMGPMVAASRFLEKLRSQNDVIPGSKEVASIKCELFGSLALTGKGHQTDRAIILGLSGLVPESLEIDAARALEKKVCETHQVTPKNLPVLQFNPASDILFTKQTNHFNHPNVLKFDAIDLDGTLHMSETYYSIGGGFIVTEQDFLKNKSSLINKKVPHNFTTASQLLSITALKNKSIARIMMENELISRDSISLELDIQKLWTTMNSSIEAGLSQDGTLPGGLNMRRRAKTIYESLKAEKFDNTIAPHIINDWISVYAIAVNEENANGGRIVTAPTNGAAGVIPATIRYYLDHIPGSNKKEVSTFILTAAAIGGLIKENASISGAEVGCQGEIGSAAAMAAAGLCAVLGGSPQQVENAAEIALEHHLGMTCDPIKGLVQAPCIERNGLGAIKAVSSASLAMRGDGKHIVSLDNCIKTMKETGRDMSYKYKETALGGLAVNIPAC